MMLLNFLMADVVRNPIYLLLVCFGMLALVLLLYGGMGKMMNWIMHMREMEFHPQRVRIIKWGGAIGMVVVLVVVGWLLPELMDRRYCMGLIGLVAIPCMILLFTWARKK